MVESKSPKDMSVNERLKYLRKSPTINLTQDKFGEKIGYQKSSISTIESGRQDMSPLMCNIICKVFHVSRDWLLYGKGDMFIPEGMFSLDVFLQERHASEIEIEIMKAYFSLDPETRNNAINQFKAYLAKEKASAASSKAEMDIEEAEQEYIKNVSKNVPRPDVSASSTTAVKNIS